MSIRIFLFFRSFLETKLLIVAKNDVLFVSTSNRPRMIKVEMSKFKWIEIVCSDSAGSVFALKSDIFAIFCKIRFCCSDAEGEDGCF